MGIDSRRSPVLPGLLWLLASAFAGSPATAGTGAGAEPVGSGTRALLSALDRVLFPGTDAGERRVAELAIEVGFGAPLSAGGTARDLARSAGEAARHLARSLVANGDATACGPLHQELERLHLRIGDVRNLLSATGDELVRAAGKLEIEPGSGALVRVLALGEILAEARSNLGSMARALSEGADRAARARRALMRMMALVENLQDSELSATRDRIPLGARPGTGARLARGLAALSERLRETAGIPGSVEGLMRIRYLSLLESMRNLARSPRTEPSPEAKRVRAPLSPGLANLEETLSGLRSGLSGHLASLESRARSLEAGEDPLPELPPLPEWLYSPADERHSPGAPEAPTRPDPALGLLDELEAELDAEDELLEDPLTEVLTRGRRDQ